MHAVDKSMFKSLQWGDSISHAHYSKECCRQNLGFDVSQVLSILRLWKECLLLNSYDHHVWVRISKSWNGFLNISVTKSWHILITANSTFPFRRNKLFSLPFLSKHLWPRVWGYRQFSKCIEKGIPSPFKKPSSCLEHSNIQCILFSHLSFYRIGFSPKHSSFIILRLGVFELNRNGATPGPKQGVPLCNIACAFPGVFSHYVWDALAVEHTSSEIRGHDADPDVIIICPASCVTYASHWST